MSASLSAMQMMRCAGWLRATLVCLFHAFYPAMAFFLGDGLSAVMAAGFSFLPAAPDVFGAHDDALPETAQRDALRAVGVQEVQECSLAL